MAAFARRHKGRRGLRSTLPCPSQKRPAEPNYGLRFPIPCLDTRLLQHSPAVDPRTATQRLHLDVNAVWRTLQQLDVLPDQSLACEGRCSGTKPACCLDKAQAAARRAQTAYPTAALRAPTMRRQQVLLACSALVLLASTQTAFASLRRGQRLTDASDTMPCLITQPAARHSSIVAGAWCPNGMHH